jgi:predicted dehydrogenase
MTVARIGIIGAENSHAAAIAKLCNVEKKVAARVVAIWGETAKFAKAAAETGQIPTIVRDWRAMAGLVDGIMIDHRHARYHAEPAAYFIGKGLPCFVDKPFTFTLAEGKRLCDLARRKKVPITSFSTIPLQHNFREFKQEVRKLGAVSTFTTIGPADLKSKYGGVFFYGIHQVDAVVELFGTDVAEVSLRKHGANGAATLMYRNGPTVTMNLLKAGYRGFYWSAVGEKSVLNWEHHSDSSPYLTGLGIFLKMFRRREEPFARERMLAPVAILEAMSRSLKLGKPVRPGAL